MKIRWGIHKGRELSGAGLYVLIFQISSLLPLLYILVASGYTRILGEKKSPEPVSVNKNTGVLGERKVATGDRSYILVFILLAMCALAGIEVIKVKRTYDD